MESKIVGKLYYQRNTGLVGCVELGVKDLVRVQTDIEDGRKLVFVLSKNRFINSDRIIELQCLN